MKITASKIVLLIIVLAAALLYGIQQRIEQFADTRLMIEQEMLFTLPAGTGRVGLENLLIKNNVIERKREFAWLLRLQPQLAEFKAGTYRLTPDMTVRQLLMLLASGKEAQFSVRFVEGSRLRDWMLILQQSEMITPTLTALSESELASRLGLPAETPLEGRFYPDTYLYTAGTSDVALLKRAYAQMERALSEVWQQRMAGLPYQTPQQLLIMASIIEKETALNEERGKVASVFVNRLQRGMRLQTDPTVIYGMGDSYTGTITRQDLRTPSAYNTYIISGLPPTPIAMPSRASLLAAANPEQTDYLYFVADGKGGHVFSTNLDSHNTAVRAYRRAQRQQNEER
ncbi:endolytic transglycosylase MltG [Serratia microhaemolytica]|uniref:endolytic transglycosylase MltG n=1 Tax=Serratia microhaemolytica TaxID=2675110 RepID=UPI000FDEA19C|nr:endolytic transglycosylase MltG [Serratia microhaemolytica]